MKITSKSIIFAGLFFLMFGVLWLTVIYNRAKAALPEEKKSIISESPVATYHEMKETLQQPSKIDRYVKKSLSAKPRKSYITLFWIVAAVEVVCCFLYIFSGIAVLRLYPFSRFLVFLALYFDVLLKGMAMTYMNAYALPLAKALNGNNILSSYFLAQPSWSSTFSMYVTGLGFYQTNGALFLFVYLVYLFIVFYFFTRPKIKEQFKR
jgi:hypothetical protein